MNCDEIRQSLDAYQGEQMSEQQKQDFEEHIHACNDCANILKIDQDILKLLKEVPVAEPSAGFEQRVFAEVRRQHKTHGQQRFVAGFATAIAASLAILVASLLIMPQQPMDDIGAVKVALYEPQPVKLMLESRTDMQEVALSIQLPANVELQGYPGQSQLSWNTRLRKGVNVLELPVIVNQPGLSEVIADVRFGDQHKQIKVSLLATESNHQSDHKSGQKSDKDGVMLPINSVTVTG